jgi:hypothetical protein
MSEGRRETGLWVLAAGSALLWALKPIAGSSALYRDVLTAGVLLRLGALVKLLFLVRAALFAHKSATRLGSGNPARLPWRLLALGFLGFAAGQAVLTGYQMLQGVTPVLSVADAAFMAGYPLLILGFFAFVRLYRAAYPVGSLAGLAALGLGAAALFTAAGVKLLAPILGGGAPWLERAVNAGYPALDLVLLVPILLLLRITWGFRGGHVWRPWALLLTGGVFMSVGDVCFAYLALAGQQALDPVVHATFILGYFLCSEGTRAQYTLLAG